jgi:hypothetical protein
LDGEVALVGPHFLDQHLGREIEVALLERSHHRTRQLDQVGDLLDQRRVLQQRPSRGGGRPAGALLHSLLAHIEVDDHVRLLERADVVGRLRELERLGGQEPMPARLSAAPDVGVDDRHHLPAEQRDDPVQRASPHKVDVAPAHRLGETQRVRRSVEHLWEDLRGALALFRHRRDEVLALGGGDASELFGPLPDALGEFSRGDLRNTVLEAGLHRGPLHLFLDVFAHVRDALYQDRQPPRGAVAPQVAVLQPRRVEALRNVPCERFERGCDERGGELFAAELEQEVSGHRSSLSAGR